MVDVWSWNSSWSMWPRARAMGAADLVAPKSPAKMLVPQSAAASETRGSACTGREGISCQGIASLPLSPVECAPTAHLEQHCAASLTNPRTHFVFSGRPRTLAPSLQLRDRVLAGMPPGEAWGGAACGGTAPGRAAGSPWLACPSLDGQCELPALRLEMP